MSTELNQYLCHLLQMYEIQDDITKFVPGRILMRVSGFITRSVRKWIIGKKDLLLS
jgi:hypothetical protein